MGALADQYNRGMGRTSEPMTLLEPKARAVFEKIAGGQPENSTGYQTGKSGAPKTEAPPPAPGLPPQEKRAIGRIYTTPTGDYIWMGNGWAKAPERKAPGSLKMPPMPQDQGRDQIRFATSIQDLNCCDHAPLVLAR